MKGPDFEPNSSISSRLSSFFSRLPLLFSHKIHKIIILETAQMAETSASSVGQFFTNSDFTSHLPTAEQSQVCYSYPFCYYFSQSFRPENPDQFFDTEGTINWIRENNFKRVALQFPDTFLPYASFVSQRIEKTLNDVKTFVLADTSYRRFGCC